MLKISCWQAKDLSGEICSRHQGDNMRSEHLKLEKSCGELLAELAKLGADPVYREAQLYLKAAHQALRSKTDLQKQPVKG